MTGITVSTTEKERKGDYASISPRIQAFSVSDVIVLLVGAVSSSLLYSRENPLGLVVFFTLAHFFLFCNVLRMCRRFELIWAVLFLCFSVSTLLFRLPNWLGTVLITLALTAVLTVLQMRLPFYHGVFWQRINPNLPQWWAKKQAAH
ncbi:MAG: hypothetical protein WGN25_13715 [Candidatus Electrothrix sp. GW3-4]|uniref:hypothetical protein n=1 Tax=Candidatus Electrothrix sp. GW3-4 TaxID=3126740 RepID=UPI0030D6087B